MAFEKADPTLGYAATIDDQRSDSTDCSPFCIFSCCNGTVACNQETYSCVHINEAQVNTHILSSYENPYAYDHSDFIWQPPKL